MLVDVIRKGNGLRFSIEERDIKIARIDQLADNVMQAAKELDHVAGAAGKLRNLEERRLQVFSTLALGDTFAQRCIDSRQLRRAPRDLLFQIGAVQDPVQCHCHVPRHHEEKLAVLSAIDPRDIVNLHRQHAENLVCGILQRCAHPELGIIADGMEDTRSHSGADHRGIDEQRLPGHQHPGRHRRALGVENVVVFRLDDVRVDYVDIVRIGDLAAFAVVQRQVEVLGIDQRTEPLVHAAEKLCTIGHGTRQIGNLIQHALRVLGTRERVGLRALSQTSGKFAQRFIAGEFGGRN